MLCKKSLIVNNEIQLLVFPHAVGSLGNYIKFKRVDNLHLVDYELPGRGHRLSEGIYDMNQIINEVVSCIDFSNEYILFGHSMGAFIAYEICSSIERRKLPKPNKLILSGQNPPNLNNKFEEYKYYSIKDSIKYFKEMGGTSKEILNNTELMSIYTDILNKDLNFLNMYLNNFEFKRLETNLEIWIGKEDKSIFTENCLDWKDFTSGNCKLLQFEGGHFFINKLLSESKRLSVLLGMRL
ncbi:Thioesterase PikA5 [uncultured Streptococcus sp.]|nr:Thioesterase PikA5 [uncultured Streptococcus sp.]